MKKRVQNKYLKKTSKATEGRKRILPVGTYGMQQWTCAILIFYIVVSQIAFITVFNDSSQVTVPELRTGGAWGQWGQIGRSTAPNAPSDTQWPIRRQTRAAAHASSHVHARNACARNSTRWKDMNQEEGESPSRVRVSARQIDVNSLRFSLDPKP